MEGKQTTRKKEKIIKKEIKGKEAGKADRNCSRTGKGREEMQGRVRRKDGRK